MKEYSLKINGNKYQVSVDSISEEGASVKVNGTAYNVEIEGGKVVKIAKPVAKPAPAAPVAPAATAPAAAPVTGGKQITCPLPGTILDIKCAVGDKVAKGQTLMVLEAMKMENNIDSDVDGTVKAINVQKGSTAMEGQVLIVIE